MLFLVKDGDVTRVASSEYGSEEEFRQIFSKIVERYPDVGLIRRSEGVEPELLLHPIREVGTSAGSIDLLYIDSEYWIYVVEMKLYRSGERRKAISQALDYAAALWCKTEEDAENIIHVIEEKSGRKLRDVEREAIKESLMNGSFKILVAFDNKEANRVPKRNCRIRRSRRYAKEDRGGW